MITTIDKSRRGDCFKLCELDWSNGQPVETAAPTACKCGGGGLPRSSGITRNKNSPGK